MRNFDWISIVLFAVSIVAGIISIISINKSKVKNKTTTMFRNQMVICITIVVIQGISEYFKIGIVSSVIAPILFVLWIAYILKIAVKKCYE